MQIYNEKNNLIMEIDTKGKIIKCSESKYVGRNVNDAYTDKDLKDFINGTSVKSDGVKAAGR